MSSSVCLSHTQICTAHTQMHTMGTHTHTHLGRLGRGEVKPGRDKVMLRHLGPVFPVSGSRHQTSWPGSDKTDRQFWRHFLKSHQAASSSEISLILCHFFSVFFFYHQLFWNSLHKCLPQDKPKSPILSRKQQSSTCCSCACEDDNWLTAWMENILCSTILCSVCVCDEM